MIYVTGDTHADWMPRLSYRNFPEGKDLEKDDYIVVLGDFGIWDGSKGEQKRLDWLESRPFTTLFVDGNHENYDILDAYPVSEWHGGKVQFIRPSVIHLMRGQVYNICGKSVFTFGGASSHDISGGVFEKGDPRIKECRRECISYRINHVSWWERELPNEKELEEGRQNLAEAGNKVDFIWTHCAPTPIAKELYGFGFKPDRLTDFLNKVYEGTDYDKWLFGHYHDNEEFEEQDMELLFEKIMRIT